MLTREQIAKEYKIDSDGFIRDLGKFEEEYLWAPYFYEMDADDIINDGEQTISVFYVDDELRKDWPEIDIDTYAILLEESGNGFILVEEATKEDFDKLLNEAEENNGPQEDDITTEDHRNFYQYHKLVLVLSIDEDADMWTELNKYMEKEKFFPNVWFVSDHGNPHLLKRDKDVTKT